EEGRLGLHLVEEARDVARALDLASVGLQRRHGASREPHRLEDRDVHRRDQVAALVIDSLVTKHQLGRDRRMRPGDDVERGHTVSGSSIVSATTPDPTVRYQIGRSGTW